MSLCRGSSLFAVIILEAVRYPDIRDAGIAQFASEVFADVAAGNAVSDPEVANVPVGVRKGEPVIGEGVGRKAWG